jgi:hypothetical protein
MISQFENLPNELFLNIFCYLSWDEILISLWSLNQRITSVICLIFSRNQNGIILNKPGLSYRIFSKILSSRFNSSSLSSSIKYIHFNGIHSISFDFIYEKIFYRNDKQTICFPNLKSLYINRCLLSKRIIRTLSLLIQYRLNQLILTFDKDIYQTFHETGLSSFGSDRGNQSIFSNQRCPWGCYRREDGSVAVGFFGG